MCKKLFGENKKILPQNEGKLIPEYLYSKISRRGVINHSLGHKQPKFVLQPPSPKENKNQGERLCVNVVNHVQGHMIFPGMCEK